MVGSDRERAERVLYEQGWATLADVRRATRELRRRMQGGTPEAREAARREERLVLAAAERAVIEIRKRRQLARKRERES